MFEKIICPLGKALFTEGGKAGSHLGRDMPGCEYEFKHLYSMIRKYSINIPVSRGDKVLWVGSLLLFSFPFFLN